MRWLARLALALALVLPGSASADTGFLDPVGCLAPPASCGGLPDDFAGFDGVRQIVASDDGTSAFAISGNEGDFLHQNALTQLARDADGRLSFVRCLGNPAGGGCGPLPDGVFMEAVAVRGSEVYTAGDNVVAHFRFNADGLRFEDCVGTGIAACAPLPHGSGVIQDVKGLALSPDGSDVYVLGDFSLVHFNRRVDGSLAFGDCIGGEICSSLPNRCPPSGCRRPFGQATGLAVGASAVYVTFTYGQPEGSWVATFRRVGGGRLSYVDCLGQGAEGCRYLPVGSTGLSGANGVAVTPSGDVYVAGWSDHESSVAHLRPNAEGSLDYVGCVGNGLGCARLPWRVQQLDRIDGIAASPDGRSLYVRTLDALYHFPVDDAGGLKLGGCVGFTAGCLPFETGGWNGQRVSAAPDGKNVYLASWTAALSFARRSAPPRPAPGTAPAILTDDPYNVRDRLVSWEPLVRAGDHAAAYWVEFGKTTGYGQHTPVQQVAAGDDSRGDSGVMANGLRPSTTYHYRVVARSAAGSTYGADRTVTTTAWEGAPYPPDVVFEPYALIEDRTAALVKCTIGSGGQRTHWAVEYGPTDAYGSTIEGDFDPDPGFDTLLIPIRSLQPDSDYHFRCTASNPDGTAAEPDTGFHTLIQPPLPPAPDERTRPATSIAATSAVLNATVNPYGRATSYRFEMATGLYGPYEGVTPWRAAGAGTTVQAFAATATALKPATTYFFRVAARTSRLTIDGAPLSFRTRSS